jgi:glycosyltransferase 2 family protein
LKQASVKERANRSRATLIAGYALAIAALFWVFHDVHPRKVLEGFAGVEWTWVFVAMIFEVTSYGVQGLRWAMLLRPLKPVRVECSVRSVFAGLFANTVLPLRPGELLRAYLLSKSEGMGFGAVLGSVGVERLIDLIVSVLGLGFFSLFVPLPAQFAHKAEVLGVVALVLVAAAVTVILYLELTLEKRRTGEPNARCPGKMMSMLIDLHTMGTSPSFYLGFLVSALLPGLQIAALWTLMYSFGLPLPLVAAAVVLLVINIGVSLPNAPANVGSYQFFCVLGLSVFGIEKTIAASFSLFAFAMLTLPIFLCGLAALLRSGVSLHEMRERLSGLPAAGRSDFN